MTRPALPLVLGALACAALLRLHDPQVVWNTTASAPLGLYRLAPADGLARGELVVFAPPPTLANDLARRGVLPLGVPLIKPVAGLGGDTVCRHGAIVTVEGRAIATARWRDRHGRRLPDWQGCRRLTPGELFLLNPSRHDSFDGRYFGPLPTVGLVGRAVPLWTWSSAAPSTGDRR
ncbi:MAG: S26 family signal peptidase [Caulobacter sp.]|nr:S26 family signal peptidase [Caulobacter sp.]